MLVYSRETQQGTVAYCWTEHQVLACLYPSRRAMGLVLSSLCAEYDLKVDYEPPADIWLGPTVLLPDPDFRARLLSECLRHIVREAAAEAAGPDRLLGSLPALPTAELRALVEPLHVQLNRCLDDGDFAGAVRTTAQLSRIRAEFGRPA